MPNLSPEGGPAAALLSPPRPKIPPGALVAGAILAAITAIVFLLPPDLLLGAGDTDLVRQFLAWRAFAADTVRSGHLPLWNPYTYAGQPFLGGFQSALLYPPNLIFLCLPLCRAANLSLLGHLFILGWGMHRFAARRGLGPAAAILCALLLPLSGAVFPHLYAGHLPNLCTMAWAPWIFAGLEDWYGERKFPGLFLASAAICLQILAGHVQYVFYCAVAAGLHALVRTLTDPAARRRALPGVAAVYLAAAALAAAQLFPGLTTVSQSIRHARLGFSFARTFSFPLENLLTFVAPGFFGDLTRHVYWGRGYLWEMSVFVGISGLMLAGLALCDREQRRATCIEISTTALLLLFAVGNHTPLFRLLYNYAPGFDRFRGISKFTFPALIFLVLAVGRGADALIHRRLPRPSLPRGALEAGGIAILAGLILRAYPEFLGGFLNLVRKTGESYLPPSLFGDPGFVRAAGQQAGRSLILAGGTLALIGGALLGAPRRPWLRWAPLLLLLLEMLGFAHSHFATARAGEALPPGLRKFVAAHPGDYRVLDPESPDNGYFLGTPDIWGNDPAPLKRYAEFITFTQGGDPDRLSQNVAFHTLPSIYAMLRFRYGFIPTDHGTQVAEQIAKPMAHVQLMTRYRLITGRNAIFSAMASPSFNPRQTVILESLPYPRPQPSDNPGSVRVVEESPDSLTVEAQVNSPALLVITDLYSRNWHARPAAPSAQKLYEIVPANYILRAIPLAAGSHRILIEYIPGGLRVGLGVSGVAWLLWLVGAFRLRKRGLRAASLP